MFWRVVAHGVGLCRFYKPQGGWLMQETLAQALKSHERIAFISVKPLSHERMAHIQGATDGVVTFLTWDNLGSGSPDLVVIDHYPTYPVWHQISDAWGVHGTPVLVVAGLWV